MIERCVGENYVEMCLYDLDDIFVYNRSLEVDLVHVLDVLQCCVIYGLKVNECA